MKLLIIHSRPREGQLFVFHSFASLSSFPLHARGHPSIFLMVNHLSSTDFYPFGNPIQKVATTNPPRFALRPSQPDGWAPPAYGRGWPRFAVATFWMNRDKVLRSLTMRFRQPSANNILNVRGGAYGWYNYIIYCQVRSDDSSAIAK